MVNELKVVFDRMGIDIWEVIKAASTKPFGFSPFYPGPGLGGHCIPIDPFYLTWKARQYGMPTRFIELAGEINTNMPHYVIEKTMDALNQRRKSLKGSKVLVLGLAYKKDVDDLRESPSLKLMELLEYHLVPFSQWKKVQAHLLTHTHYISTAGFLWNEVPELSGNHQTALDIQCTIKASQEILHGSC